MTANHSHHPVALREESRAKMLVVLGLTSGYMVLEVVAGMYTHSLALLADAGHMLSDVAALSLGLLALWFSSRPATFGKSYGYYRSEILAGLLNSLLLIGISFFILYEAYRRLQNPPEVISGPVLAVALVGLVVNVLSVTLLGRLAEQSVNVKAAYLEVLSDMLATIGVIAASLIMLFTKWYLADPLISGAIGLFILPRTWLLLTECINILMEGAPGYVDVKSLRESMLQVPNVLEVHDVHVWTITSGVDAMSAHVLIDEGSAAEVVLQEITKLSQEEFGLHHTTIQVEQAECKRQGKDICKG